ncbi:TonB-dependent receptor [Aquimarina sp. AD10]|uniref:TonB-dependent receptor n=1 Tax=Aquimarina sp. AD10 TaxID=1714849 RepID=UPI000E5564BC|nr:TonB-dependent receptor [Aquimarina sp. AD10]AXT63320.1 TonB-dependent receptor [Aquimarina sp. AD10]RKN00667.1 TonB-dependent receptor [Aquimarina sp. AD10]
MRLVTILLFTFFLISIPKHSLLNAQETETTGSLEGVVYDENGVLPFANIFIEGTSIGSSSDDNGTFSIHKIPIGTYKIIASFTGYNTIKKKLSIKEGVNKISLTLSQGSTLDEVVVSGTLKPVIRSESPVPVEIYSPTFFKKNPTPNLFEALQNVNGVRPQLNCSICNTGDIHINGLEGPYTLVMIDGMPIVSGLSTVYGLSGIPNSLIERIEVVKGPASSLYGSEAVGGLINIITKNPDAAPEISTDVFASGWGETNIDFGFKARVGKATALVGANYFFYDQVIDKNEDGFTDLTLQDRISIFNKWNFKRSSGKNFTLAGRFYYEDRWGGENEWDRSFRGSDEIYGESIYTTRYEVLGSYELPTKEPISLSFSYTNHDQNSFYGDVSYQAKQRIGFTQLAWDKRLKSHDLLFGAAYRYQYYDDNTTATGSDITNDPEETKIPGVFVQDEITLASNHKLLLGSRLDYDDRHGSIFTPRIAYKWSINDKNIFRLNAGTGFRVVNLFTEEHAALTGSREVIVEENLAPEESYNVNLNYIKKIFFDNGTFIGLDASAWYTHFTNAIIPDYDTNPQQIRYGNLDGYAVSTGVSLNSDINFSNGLKVMAGFSALNVSNTDDGIRSRQVLTESFTGTWGVTYKVHALNLTLDYTGNAYGPMRLPTLGPNDPRRDNSPWYSIQNIQFTYKSSTNLEIYGGVKNLLDWTPNRGNPFLISRAEDPFDNNVQFNQNGDVLVTADNPYGLTFDSTYIYGPNQGARGFLGVRYTLL